MPPLNETHQKCTGRARELLVYIIDENTSKSTHVVGDVHPEVSVRFRHFVSKPRHIEVAGIRPILLVRSRRKGFKIGPAVIRARAQMGGHGGADMGGGGGHWWRGGSGYEVVGKYRQDRHRQDLTSVLL